MSRRHLIFAILWMQMAILEQLASELRQEYTVRRRMLIERAKVCTCSILLPWATCFPQRCRVVHPPL